MSTSMNSPIQDDAFTCTVVVRSDALELAHLYAESFTQREPMNACLNQSIEDYTWSQAIAEYAADQGLSIIIRHHGTLVAYCLAWDAIHDPFADLVISSTKTQPVGAILTELSALSTTKTKIHSSMKKLYIAVIGTASGFEGKRLAFIASQRCLSLAKEKGFEAASVEVTSHSSRRIFEKLGFEPVCGVFYKEFEFNGQKPFESIGESQTSIGLMEKVGL